jgi:hypothetical protein
MCFETSKDCRQRSARLRGPTSVLDAPVVEETSPECRAQLGDRRCRVDLSGRRISAVVVSVVDIRPNRLLKPHARIRRQPRQAAKRKLARPQPPRAQIDFD